MALLQSAEVVAKEASPGEKYSNLDGVKAAEFNYTTTASTAIADNIEVVELPVGSQIVGYAITDAGSGCSDADLGTAAGGVQIATGLAITATTVSGMVAPVALGTTGKVYLGWDAGTPVASKLINGVIFYI